MGVRGLYPLLQKLAPKAIRTVKVEDLRGKSIAVDGNLLLFREYTSPWLEASQPNKHIIWVIRLVRLCKKHDIVPIVVFDSKETTPAKAQERIRRGLVRDKVKNTLYDASARASRLRDLSATFRKIEDLPVTSRQAVNTRLIDAAASYRHAGHARFDEVKKSDHGGQESTLIAHDLVKHINSVLSLDQTTSNVSSELGLLMKLVDPDNTTLPVQEAQDLQVATAEIMEKLSRRVAFPTYKDIDVAFIALKRLGVPCTISPDLFEGECTASYLVKSGLAQSVATQDSDVLIHGVPQLRQFMSIGNQGGYHVLTDATCVDPAIAREELASQDEPWSEQRFLDFALLCGTDFTRSIAKLGIRSALRYMQEHDTIENALPHIRNVKVRGGTSAGQSRYNVHDDFLADIEIARNIFQSYPKESLEQSFSSSDRVQSLSAIRQQSEMFRIQDNNDPQYEAEKDVLNLEGMTHADIAMLDDPRLYSSMTHRPGLTLESGNGGFSGFVFR